MRKFIISQITLFLESTPRSFRLLSTMPTWKLDSTDYLTSMLVDRCPLPKQLNSSDDDSADSGIFLPWMDSCSFEELDAYLTENPPGWSPNCECGDNKLSLCSFCLSNSTDSFFSFPVDDTKLVDFWIYLNKAVLHLIL